MTRKFSKARRAAFVKAVAETGNQSLAAARAKVSRSWVTMTRAQDPAFDARVRAAIAQARESLSPAPDQARGARGLKPPSGWGYLDGVQLVVRGTGGSTGPAPRPGGRRTQIARARLKQWDPATEDRFLAVLAATCNVKAACSAAGMSAPGAYAHRRRWAGFARRWDAALEEGYTWLEIGLVEAAGNLFSSTEPPPALPDAPVTGVTAADALHLLRLHRATVRGVGKRAGGPVLSEPLEKATPQIIRAIRASLLAAGRADVVAEIEAEHAASGARGGGAPDGTPPPSPPG